MYYLSRHISLILCLGIAAACPASALDFRGSADTPVEVVPEASTGLAAVYVLPATAGVEVSYPSPTASWSLFGAAGAAFAEPVAARVEGASSVVTLKGGDTGILIEDAGRQHCYWITDYSGHRFTIAGLHPSGGEYPCDNVVLGFEGDGAPIQFYSINGRAITLDRDISVVYTTLVADKEAGRYIQAETNVSMPYITPSSYVAAPLCDTQFGVEGDRFLRAWQQEASARSDTYAAVAVQAVTTAVQTERDAENEQNPATGSLGGSAPCEITFAADVTDAVAYREWQISRTPDFDILENSYNQDEFSYTFVENGTFYVRFTAADATGACSYTGETYEVSIGESKLLCPNAFTPHTSPGVNDEWRVSYQSIVEFHCEIFNRWGSKIITLTDPSQGWDGTIGGKKASPGVYYYVIRARGADGKAYNLSGDINIIGARDDDAYGASGSD